MSGHGYAAHEEWDELAAGYALHALDPDDEERFVAHLGGCAQCRASSDEHSRVAAHLASLAESDDIATPGWASIRRGILVDADDESGAQADAPAEVVPLADRRSRRAGNRRVGVLAAAAAAVLVAGGATVVAREAWGPSERSPLVAATEACAKTVGCRPIRLLGSAGKPRTVAVVLVTGNRAAVVPLALDPLADDRTYVLWQLPRDGRPVAVHAFRSTSTPSEETSLSTTYDDTAAFAVSREPLGVGPRPTEVLAIGSTA